MGWPQIWRWMRRDATTHALVALSGLAAIGVLAYTAPGTPWSDAARVVAPPPSASAAMPGMDMADHAAMDMTATAGRITHAGGYTVLFDLAPGHVGRTTVAVTALAADGGPAEVQQWSATATPPGGGTALPVPLRPFGPGVATADVTLATAGPWSLSVTFRTASGTTTATQSVPVTAFP